MTIEELVNIIYTTLPYHDQIHNMDFTSDTNAIEFDWRGSRLRITASPVISVYEIKGDMREGSNLCIILRTLLNRTKLEREMS